MTQMGDKNANTARMAPGAKVTLDERVSLMDEIGIDLQVLSPASRLPYFAGREDAVAAARLGNDIYADVVARNQKITSEGAKNA